MVQGNSWLTGPIPDQAALYGILCRFRDLGLTLVSLATQDGKTPGSRTVKSYSPAVLRGASGPAAQPASSSARVELLTQHSHRRL